MSPILAAAAMGALIGFLFGLGFGHAMGAAEFGRSPTDSGGRDG